MYVLGVSKLRFSLNKNYRYFSIFKNEGKENTFNFHVANYKLIKGKEKNPDTMARLCAYMCVMLNGQNLNLQGNRRHSLKAEDLRLLTKRASDEIPSKKNSWAGRKCCAVVCVTLWHPVLFKTIVELRHGGRASAECQNSGGTRQITSNYKIRPAGGLVARCILFL